MRLKLAEIRMADQEARKQLLELRRMLTAAIAALQVAASDVVGDDQLARVEKIASWLKRAEQLLRDPDDWPVQ